MKRPGRLRFFQAFSRAALRRLRHLPVEIRQRRRDSIHSTFFSGKESELPGLRRPNTFQALTEDWAWELAQGAFDAVSNNLVHRFDLLGSGWQTIRHGMVAPGYLGCRAVAPESLEPDPDGNWLVSQIPPGSLPESRRIWKLLTELSAESGSGPSYVPLDWHVDFRTGHRWRSRTWFKDIRPTRGRGHDIKVPWELARLQHLPRFALVHAALRNPQAHPVVGDSRSLARRLQDEFVFQTLDFIATNPPRWGVNWASTMDVAIRAANLLVAHDLFLSQGVDFAPDFSAVLTRSIFEHGRHIADHLEWRPHARGNHYLANITGLLFVATYLEESPTSDRWLALAIQEFCREVELQFQSDGSNFEGSTCYHRLSAEMVVYGAALIQGLPPSKLAALQRLQDCLPHGGSGPLHSHPVGIRNTRSRIRSAQDLFPAGIASALDGMAGFTAAVTKPNGLVAQIGDNDSGRFFKIFPTPLRGEPAAGQATDNLDPWVRFGDHSLWHGHLLDAAGAILPADRAVACPNLETRIIELMAGSNRFSFSPADTCVPHSAAPPPMLGVEDIEKDSPTPDTQTVALDFPMLDLRAGLQIRSFPDFGLYIFRSEGFFLSVRCGSVGQAGKGGHAHSDQLAVELNVNGRDYISDPGSLTYTGRPDLRNLYRSAAAHFVPRISGLGEPADLDQLFGLPDRFRARCLHFGPEFFLGVHHAYGRPVYRRVEIEEHRVIITDTSFAGPLVRHYFKAGVFQGTAPFSPGYGELEPGSEVPIALNSC